MRPSTPRRSIEPSDALRAATDANRDVVAHAGKAVLALGALGIVYGDIGTSPLYAEQVIFTALIKGRRLTGAAALVTLGIFGAGLFFGDGMITPISVISAVEGLNIATPGLAPLVVPIALGILVGLFAAQRLGTGAVGWLFGPVILIWFVVIGGLGLREVVAHPSVLQGLAPVWAVRFPLDHGVVAFLTLGAVVLAVTGAEALYADRGHFGAGPIRLTWFTIVFPAVMLSYLGQAALVHAHPSTVSNPFFLLVPSGLRIPMVILATMATIIASQAAITGSFSVAKQAVQLGFLPRLKIVHTSKLEGQIYVPLINWMLAIGVAALVLWFQKSTRLAEIYGVAVTGTCILNTILFMAVARSTWHTARFKLIAFGSVLLTVEVAFFSSNLTKIAHGTWLPLGGGLGFAFVMMTWRTGRDILTRNRTEQEGSLAEFLVRLRTRQPPLVRVRGTAIYLNPGKQTTPLALRAEVEHNHVLHDKVVIVSVETVGIPQVDDEDRLRVEWLGEQLFKVAHVTYRVGYQDKADIPRALALARKRGLLERSLDLEHASYFVSRMSIVPRRTSGMVRPGAALRAYGRRLPVPLAAKAQLRAGPASGQTGVTCA